MRKNFFYLCAALFALSSCTNEIIEEGFVDKSNAISFNSSAPKTRDYSGGDITGTTDLQEGNFGVVGYSEGNLYLGATTKAAEQTYDTGNNWKYVNDDEIRYWPNNNMDFYAYFPYSETGDVFANSLPADNGTPVMTITNESGNQDVLFASTLNQPRVDRVDMKFHHAFSKIQGIEIQIQNKDVTVEVQKIEVINTSTKGNVLVDKYGYAKYAAGEEARVFTLATPVTITKASTYDNGDDQFQTLVQGTDNGYIFATNRTIENHVSGTGTPLWDGTNAGWGEGKTLENLEQVCLKLTCKVTTPKTGGVNYHVGSVSTYGVMYIPITGSKVTATSPSGADTTPLLAGKRYTYKIIMKENVGFDVNGNAILRPILFQTTTMDSWEDVTVTITL